MSELDKVLKTEANELAQEVAFGLDYIAGDNGRYLISFKKLERVILEAMLDGARFQRIALGCEPDDEDEELI